jgi:hypothetical protein
VRCPMKLNTTPRSTTKLPCVKRPDDARSFDTKSRLHHVVNVLGASMPESVELIREFIDVGEETLAIETIVANLYEVGAPVPVEPLAELRALWDELNAHGPFPLPTSSSS